MTVKLHEYEKRSVTISDIKTTISMERMYWKVIEKIAAKRRYDWRYMVELILRYQPKDYRSRAGWLRLYAIGYAYSFLTRSSAGKIHAVFAKGMEGLSVQLVQPKDLKK